MLLSTICGVSKKFGEWYQEANGRQIREVRWVDFCFPAWRVS
jgi:CobQ-like glutamine amidotransferase family enzyme